MVQEIYLDVVFFTNFLMDYLLLHLIGRLLCLKGGHFRRLIGAAFGAAGSCVLLLYSKSDSYGRELALHALLALGMLLIGCKIHSLGVFVRAMAALYLSAFLCGGFWDVISHGREMSLKAFFFFAACTYVVLTIVEAYREHRLRKQQDIYPVTLFYQGRQCQGAALYDTGNRLRDTDGRRPVSVASKALMEELLTEELMKKLKNIQDEPEELENTVIESLKPHFLRCSTVGGTQVLLTVTIEKLSIRSQREELQISYPVMAIALEASALGKEYQIILNSELIP
ncbi:MAG: sigma-E processing peptidase SpoIIGA [Eubacteriales bacterium]|nr:sigma-E processing peptidase SpoIIGA [Eubacteriales bacterium]